MHRALLFLRALTAPKSHTNPPSSFWKAVIIRGASTSPKIEEVSSSKAPEVKVKNNKPITKSSTDPFGIEEHLVDSSSSSLLVQGNYSSSKSQNTETHQLPDDQDHESRRRERLSMYDGWLRNRIQIQENQSSNYDEEGEHAVAADEKIRLSKGGTVRLDSDNVPTRDGQFDTLSPDFIAQKEAEAAQSQEERKPQPKTTAFEFLRKHKAAEKAITTNIQPKSIAKLSVNFTTEDAPELDIESLDSNKVPKAYQLPDYNKITQGDMWNILKSQIIFQNDILVAMNKPFGIPMHSPARNCRHYIIQFLQNLAEHCSVPQLHPLHRLDRETTGILLFAKNEQMSAVIRQKFAKREIEKTYLAITKLCPQYSEGVIKIPIGEGIPGGSGKYRSVLKPDLRDYKISTSQTNCKEAETHFKVLSSIKDCAFLEIRPITGVKHQIRVHLGLGLGCPILGDHKYSHRDKMAPQRLPPQILHRLKLKQSKVREVPMHLHCSKISFELPTEVSKEPIFIHAKIPHYFTHTLRSLRLKK